MAKYKIGYGLMMQELEIEPSLLRQLSTLSISFPSHLSGDYILNRLS
jgi:hypothetical protein